MQGTDVKAKSRKSRTGIHTDPQKLLDLLQKEYIFEGDVSLVLKPGLAEEKSPTSIRFDIKQVGRLGFHDGSTVKGICEKKGDTNPSCSPSAALVVLRECCKKLDEEEGWLALIIDETHLLLVGYDNGQKKVRCYPNCSEAHLSPNSRLVVSSN